MAKLTQSPPMTLSRLDIKKTLSDSAYYSLVPLGFYIDSILNTISQENHILSLSDFALNNTTAIIFTGWLLNQILNIVRKYARGTVV